MCTWRGHLGWEVPSLEGNAGVGMGGARLVLSAGDDPEGWGSDLSVHYSIHPGSQEKTNHILGGRPP